MIVYALLGVVFLYARMVIAIAILLIGFVIFIPSSKLRYIGIAACVASLSYILYLFLTPERIDYFGDPPMLTKFIGAPFESPPVLVMHGVFQGPTEARNDALALAETGLFRVLLAGLNRSDPIIGEAVLSSAGNCVESRANLSDGIRRTKTSDLIFTARTGFQRCAKIVFQPVEAGDLRLDLWRADAPGEPKPRSDGNPNLLGVVLLTLSKGGETRNVARIESNARRVANAYSRLGAYSYDSRPPNSKLSFYYGYDPDVIGLVLNAVRANIDNLPLEGRLSDQQLVEKSRNILARMKNSYDQRSVSAILLGVMQVKISEADGPLKDIIVKSVGPGRLLEIRVPSDCPIAERLMETKQFLQSCDNIMQKQNSNQRCSEPFDKIAYQEYCTKDSI